MKVIFRVDASIEMGAGHVMRCLSLADALRDKGVKCIFICRKNIGDLIKYIRRRGYAVNVLSGSKSCLNVCADSLVQTSHRPHLFWLGTTQEDDAAECALFLRNSRPDWLIVDQYAIDVVWERILRPYCKYLMVIDDLADRHHLCDMMLDQTFGRKVNDYQSLVPAHSTLLCGAQYALLRPEFASLRSASLERRTRSGFNHLFISMGGVDKGNATGEILEALKHISLPAQCRMTVVMGSNAPWFFTVQRQVEELSVPVNLCSNVSNMALLMADSDLAIGAAGSTAWERCCLGLPTAMVVLAENQTYAAKLLEQAQAAKIVHLGENLTQELAAFINEIMLSDQYLIQLCHNAKNITDGMGCLRVVDKLMERR